MVCSSDAPGGLSFCAISLRVIPRGTWTSAGVATIAVLLSAGTATGRGLAFGVDGAAAALRACVAGLVGVTGGGIAPGGIAPGGIAVDGTAGAAAEGATVGVSGTGTVAAGGTGAAITTPLTLGTTARSGALCGAGAAKGVGGGVSTTGADTSPGPLGVRERDTVVPGTVSPTGRIPGGSSRNV